MSTGADPSPTRPVWRGYGPRPPAPSRQPPGPVAGARMREPRLLAGWQESGRAAGLREHLDRHGFAPGLDPEQIVDAVERAGLTGRGGAAFPTARKLRAVAAGHKPSVVVANGMESEPASRKDETLLALAPNLVLDGMVLAARAVGADEAHLCVPRSRPEQAQQLRDAVVERWSQAIDPVQILVHELPHHYVSSEETSLIRWLNGGQARPASVPPRPFERGVRQRPTLVDNVETLAHLALIARHGPDWFRARGVPDAPGTTLVTLSGTLARPGVYEVELGAPLREVIALGGSAEHAQAVLLGGYFGAWLPIDEARRLQYSAPAIAASGGGIGAGVIAVLPQGACGLAETARVLDYLAAHSARQCGPCRFGLPAAARDFADLAWGAMNESGWQRLQDHVGLLTGRGACKHPDGASRLAASALRTFAAEARRHLTVGPCAAARAEHGVLQVPRVASIGEEDWV